MGMLFMEAVGPRGEVLALRAGEATGIPVGWDAETDAATFDSDEHDAAELEAVVLDALNGIDAGWREHLRVAE